MTNTTTRPLIQYPRYSTVEQWQYEQIVLAGKPESITWADRHCEQYARMFAHNPSLSTGRIRSRTLTVEYRNKKDFRGSVIAATPWAMENIDQSDFDPLTAGAA